MAPLNFGICDKEFIPSTYQVTIETLISNIGIDSNVLKLRFGIALTLTFNTLNMFLFTSRHTLDIDTCNDIQLTLS